MKAEELAARTGEPLARLREWQAQGLLAPDTQLESSDELRVRLIQLLLSRGIPLEAISRGLEGVQGDTLSYYLGLFVEGRGRAYSLAEASEAAGLGIELVERFLVANGLGPFDTITDEDVEALRLAKAALDTGFPEEAVLQMTRIYADALGRVAAAEGRMFHVHIHEGLRGTGVPREQIAALMGSTSDLFKLTEASILYFHRKGMQRATREDLVLHLAEELGLTELPTVPGEVSAAILFCDLASYTPLTEAMGDLEAARTVDRFSHIVRSASRATQGQIVRQIGDGFMLALPDGRRAVECGVDVLRRVEIESRFPAVRVGASSGPVLYRDGDYFGSRVNIASRLEELAARNQMLVTGSVRREASESADVEFIPRGEQRLKGVAEAIEVFEVRPLGHGRSGKVTDPVCGMELHPDDAAARLTVSGEDRFFCSEECLRRFASRPGAGGVD